MDTMPYSNIMHPQVEEHEKEEATERQARIDLALAYRLMDWLGLTDLTHTHLSARVPGEEGHFLQLPYGYLFSEATASSMVKCDMRGNVVSDPSGLGISRGGFTIHHAVHQARSDAAVVMHLHSTPTVAVASQRDGLHPWTQHAMRFHGKIGYMDFVDRLSSETGIAALIDALGDNDVLMLRNHGPIVVGRSAAEAFSRVYYLEFACRNQLAMQAAGAPVVEPSAQGLAFMAHAFRDEDQREAKREWSALRRMMLQRDDSFQN